MKKLLRKSKKALCNFFHIRWILTSETCKCCSLKTVGREARGKSPFFTVKKDGSHCCGKMGKMKKIKKLHSLYFCLPNKAAKLQQCRYKIVEKVPRRGGDRLKWLMLKSRYICIFSKIGHFLRILVKSGLER